MSPIELKIIPGGQGGASTVDYKSAGGTKNQIALELEPVIMHVVNAQIPVLPEPLKLKSGPLLATVETWSDGTVVARMPSLALYAEGGSDTIALAELAEEVYLFAESVSKLLAGGKIIGGPLEYQWNALNALVDISALSK